MTTIATSWISACFAFNFPLEYKVILFESLLMALTRLVLSIDQLLQQRYEPVLFNDPGMNGTSVDFSDCFIG